MYHGEKLNSLTHLLGAVIALLGLFVLIITASSNGDVWRIVSFSIYGTSLFLLYLFSTLYHSTKGSLKAIFKKLDHIGIYLLIAGTYTPFVLVSLNGVWGWSLFGVIWGLAIIGILLDCYSSNKRRVIQLIIYVLMGWIALIAYQPLIVSLSMAGFLWLLGGGLFYSFGIIFYITDKKKLHFHGIWHMFVLAGSATHYYTVMYYVL
ncbi:MAG: hemolysin III family protein [Gammaproteobacteria bacterium]|nr:hemolysin III family protein [Gammaproteobacteria bacterium]